MPVIFLNRPNCLRNLSIKMEHYSGRFNNTLYNAISWLILIFYIIHYLFDVSVNALLRRMRFKEYVRIRLRRSLWYFGFYACGFLYCSATSWKNHIAFPNKYTFYILDLTEPISDHLIVGYALLSAFYASSFIWEMCQCSLSSFSYVFLSGFTAFTYYLRYIELVVLFTNTFSIVYVITELIRCLLCIIKLGGTTKLLMQSVLCMLLSIYSVLYLWIIPMNFLLPLAQGFLNNSSSFIMIGLNLSLWGWFACEVYTSPLYRLILHQWYHRRNPNNVPECLGSTTECALFLPRDDVAYNLKIIRREIQERQDKVMTLRKPKKKACILFQTLKCVAALNKKMKFRKQTETNSENDAGNEAEETSTLMVDNENPDELASL